MKHNLVALPSLSFVFISCISCIRYHTNDSNHISLESDSSSSESSSIEEFDFNFNYIEYDLRNLYGFIKANNYNPYLELLLDGDALKNLNFDRYAVGFSFNGYDIYINFEKFKSGYLSITNYSIFPKAFLTIDKAIDLGLFGKRITHNYWLYYKYNTSLDAASVISTETFWQSVTNFDLSFDFFRTIGMWDSTIFMFNQGKSWYPAQTGTFYKPISSFPIYSNDLTNIVGTTCFDNEGMAYTYLNSDYYNEFIARDEYIDHFRDAKHLNKSFGRARFYFNKRDCIDGEYPLMDNYTTDCQEFWDKMAAPYEKDSDDN